MLNHLFQNLGTLLKEIRQYRGLWSRRPQQGYLKEIRALMGDRLRKEQYSNEAVVSHLSERLRIADRTRVTYTLPLTREQAGDLIRMTPLTFGAEPDMLDASSLSEITIDVEILIAKK